MLYAIETDSDKYQENMVKSSESCMIVSTVVQTEVNQGTTTEGLSIFTSSTSPIEAKAGCIPVSQDTRHG
jgi:hypothetical protein